MQKRKIGIPATGFIGWGGGIDFLRMLIRGILVTGKYDVVILIPSNRTLRNKIRNTVKIVANQVISLLSVVGIRKRKYVLQDIKDQSYLFKEFYKEVTVAVYKHNTTGLKQIIKKQAIELLIPCIDAIDYDIDIPWIGYLYDFQHKYLTQFFNPIEIKNREIHFDKMVASADKIIVNSHAVKKDVNRFYPNNNSEVVSLPFTPLFSKQLLVDHYDKLKIKYNLPEKYFIISNQFWQHKSHLTAFQALKIFLEKTGENIAIVCTGETNDYRHATYFKNLQTEIQQLGIEGNVLFLGYISKQDQIQILLHAIALIQPTLFEGGPGGGATYDAVAFGKPAIVSNIEINKEIESPLVTFFQVSNPNDLAEKMASVFAANANFHFHCDSEKLERESAERIKILGESLHLIIEAELEK